MNNRPSQTRTSGNETTDKARKRSQTNEQVDLIPSVIRGLTNRREVECTPPHKTAGLGRLQLPVPRHSNCEGCENHMRCLPKMRIPGTGSYSLSFSVSLIAKCRAQGNCVELVRFHEKAPPAMASLTPGRSLFPILHVPSLVLYCCRLFWDCLCEVPSDLGAFSDLLVRS